MLIRQDNTNPDADGRKEWIEFARKHDVPIRCVWFKVPKALCEHNDVFRALNKPVSRLFPCSFSSTAIYTYLSTIFKGYSFLTLM